MRICAESESRTTLPAAAPRRHEQGADDRDDVQQRDQHGSSNGNGTRKINSEIRVSPQAITEIVTLPST